MVVPKVTTLFEVTGCKFVIKMADLVAADSYEVYNHIDLLILTL